MAEGWFGRLRRRLFHRRRRHFDAVITSFGGSGTTMLLDFLGERMRVNDANSFVDGIKHANSPNHPALEGREIGCAIYIYGDPVHTVLSLFRRGYYRRMIYKLSSDTHRDGPDYFSASQENRTEITLDEFVERGEDLFSINRHWKNWTTAPLRFPVAFVRQAELIHHIPDVLEFAGLTRADALDYPAERQRARTGMNLDQGTLAKLTAIYAETLADMARRPAFFVREPEETPGRIASDPEPVAA